MAISARKASVLAAALAALALAAAPAASMQADRAPDARTLAAWTGVWVIADSFMDKQDGTSVATGGARTSSEAPRRRGTLEEPAYKGEYLARYTAFKAAEKAAEDAGAPLARGDRGSDSCGPSPFLGEWMGPYASEIIMGPTQIIFFQEFKEQIRRIYMDGRPHPDLKEFDPKYKGHSIGRWEGPVLVIDTIGVRVDDRSYSARLHIVERLTMTAPDNLSLEVTVNDPDALAKPRTLSYRLRRKPAMEVMDSYCQENNRNPTGPNGETLTILKSQ